MGRTRRVLYGSRHSHPDSEEVARSSARRRQESLGGIERPRQNGGRAVRNIEDPTLFCQHFAGQIEDAHGSVGGAEVDADAHPRCPIEQQARRGASAGGRRCSCRRHQADCCQGGQTIHHACTRQPGLINQFGAGPRSPIAHQLEELSGTCSNHVPRTFQWSDQISGHNDIGRSEHGGSHR